MNQLNQVLAGLRRERPIRKPELPVVPRSSKFSDWKWECHRRENAHNAICPLRLLYFSGPVRKGPDGEEIRCFSSIAECTQGRAFAHGVWPGDFNIPTQVSDSVESKETARQQAAAHNSNSPFLKLPGEIRNFIYERVLENIYERVLDNKENGEVRLLYRCPFSSHLYQGNDYGGSLTQVSQQIRHEFYKDFLYVVDPILWIEDLPAYMDFWLPRMATNGARVTIEIVGVVECSNCVRPNRPEFIVDITKLVEFRQIYPFFDFRIERHKFTAPEDAAAGHEAEYPPKDHVRYVEEAIEKIQLRLEDHGRRLFVRFRLKRQFYVDWFEDGADVKNSWKEKFSDFVHWVDEILVEDSGLVCPTFVEIF